MERLESDLNLSEWDFHLDKQRGKRRVKLLADFFQILVENLPHLKGEIQKR